MKKNRLIFIFLFFAEIMLFAQNESNQNIVQIFNSIQDKAYIAMSDTNYLVTAGDVYGLSYVMSGKLINVNLIVDISYNVKILNLVTINVNGLTFSQFKKQVEDIIRKNYPLSGAQLVMIRPAVFTVMIKGEVIKAAEVQASALTRLSKIIENSFTEYSSTRNIEIVSMNGKKRSYDLFMAYRNGDFSQDPFLRPGDTIIINRLDRKVTITGSVERPGTYEILKEDNLKELIEVYGGGLKEFSDISKLTVARNNKTEDFPLGNFFKIEDIDKIGDFKLQNNDIIHIPNELEFKSAIIFNVGANITPIPFVEGSDLLSVVRSNRDKLSTLADTKNAYLMRNGEKVYTNFNKIFYDINYKEKILLEAGDSIVIPEIVKTVTVAGAVSRPGVYAYVPGKTYEYYIALAGGFYNGQNLFSWVKIKDASGKKMNKADDILPDSVITVSYNVFLYSINPYLGFISTVLAIVATTLSLVFTLKDRSIIN